MVNSGVFDVLLAGEKFRFQGFDDRFKRLVVFAGFFLHAHDHVAVHLDEAAVAIPGEAGIVAGLFQGDDGLVVEAEVEDGVHHARHGIARAGTDGDQEGLFDVAETFAEDASRCWRCRP